MRKPLTLGVRVDLSRSTFHARKQRRSTRVSSRPSSSRCRRHATTASRHVFIIWQQIRRSRSVRNLRGIAKRSRGSGEKRTSCLVDLTLTCGEMSAYLGMDAERSKVIFVATAQSQEPKYTGIRAKTISGKAMILRQSRRVFPRHDGLHLPRGHAAQRAQRVYDGRRGRRRSPVLLRRLIYRTHLIARSRAHTDAMPK